MQELSRPIHFPSVFEEHMEATGQRQQSASPQTGTLHRSFPSRSQCNCTLGESQPELHFGLGEMPRLLGLTGLQKKTSWERRWFIPGSHIFPALNCWKCCSCLDQWVQERSTQGVILMGKFFPTCSSLCEISGRRRQSLVTFRLLKSLLLVWSRLVALGSCGRISLAQKQHGSCKDVSFFPYVFFSFLLDAPLLCTSQGQIQSSHGHAACSKCSCW